MSDSPVSTHRRLLSYDRRAGALLYLTVTAGCVSAALVVALAWLLADVIGRVFIDRESLSDVAPALAMMAALMVLRE
jgi:ABC-type transport system involved in cytochrome bd biosynthesis fused ATPase/permease subunit